MKKMILLLFPVLLISTFSLKAASLQLTVNLKNGDVVTGKSTMSKISVVSAYGTLIIPADKISNLKLGILSDHTKDGAVLPDLSKLQNIANDTEAKIVYDRVIGYGTPILSTVLTYTQNPFYKIADRDNYTIENLIDELYKKANLTPGQSVNDVVTFDGSNFIEGSVELGDIIIQAEYGNLTLKRDKIESIEISPVEEVSVSLDGNYKLKAGYHISGNEHNKGWLNTGVKVLKGDKFIITATGKIVLKSLSGGTYSPDGYVSGIKDGAYSDDMSTQYGTLVYKIGDDGDMYKAGSKYEGIAGKEGVIFISIYESVYNKANTGYYTVKVVKK